MMRSPAGRRRTCRFPMADHALIAAAHEVLARHYKPFWHTVAAAIRGRDGRMWTGLHIGATVGRLSVCAEAVAFGRALLEGDGIDRDGGGGAASEAGRSRIASWRWCRPAVPAAR